MTRSPIELSWTAKKPKWGQSKFIYKWIYSCAKIVKWLVGAFDKWFLRFRLHYRETDRLRWQIHSCQGQSGNKSKRSGRLRTTQPASTWSLLLVLSPSTKALLPPGNRFWPNTLRWGCIWKQWMWKKLGKGLSQERPRRNMIVTSESCDSIYNATFC